MTEYRHKSQGIVDLTEFARVIIKLHEITN